MKPTPAEPTPSILTPSLEPTTPDEPHTDGSSETSTETETEPKSEASLESNPELVWPEPTKEHRPESLPEPPGEAPFEATIDVPSPETSPENDNGRVLWAAAIESSLDVRITGMVVDNNGNSYITGEYLGGATMGTMTLPQFPPGIGIFVAMLNSQGAFVWARGIIPVGGSLGASNSSIAVDNNGNTYITGRYDQMVAFGSLTIGNKTPTETGMFVTSLDSQGNFRWVFPIKKAHGNIMVDSGGNPFIVGTYSESRTISGTATFGTITLTSQGDTDIFVAKLNGQGIFQWVISAGGKGDDAAGIAKFDNHGNLYLTGRYTGTATFGTTTLSQGGSDMFIAKVSSQGVFQWANSIEAYSSSASYEPKTVDNNGNTYIFGRLAGTATFGTISLTFPILNTFIAKVSSQGKFLWVMASSIASGGAISDAIVDSNDNIYFAGFDWDRVSKNFDVTVAKFDSQGRALWFSSSGGREDDRGLKIAMDNNNNLYIAGSFTGTATFGTTTFKARNFKDGFVAKVKNW